MPDLIQQYFNEQRSLKGLSDVTVRSRTNEIRCLLRHCPVPLEAITTRDVLETISRVRAHGYAENTLRHYIATFKRVLLWMIEQGYPLDEKKIRAIKIPAMNLDTKRSDDLLTLEEVESAIKSCSNSRDRAIIAMLYDGSHRPVEIRALRWGDILYDAYGLRVVTNQKTGKERKIRHVLSLPYLEAWRQDWIGIMGRQPQQGDYVFISTRGDHQPLTHSSIREICADLKKRTGNRKIRPSIFRPSRITHDVESGMDQAYLMYKNWGHPDTRMLRVYAKPGEDYMDRIALEAAGVKVPGKKRTDRTLKPVICPSCNTLNPLNAEHCIHCGFGLTDRAQALYERFAAFANDPDSLIRFGKFLKERQEKNGGVYPDKK